LSDEREAKSPKLDLNELKRLVAIMVTSDLAEVEIEEQGKRVKVVRAGRVSSAAAAPATAAPALATGAPPAPAASPAPLAAPATPEAPRPSRGVEITSPMVGTFYRAPSPDAAPYVEVGDRVSKDSPVCIVEAMKVMNEIKAEVEGEILEILVQNGEPVEFGQPLFLVRPTGGAA
jgi:acetyl-CoA carboxylase biotin carboxyl carrier protein